LSSFVFQEIGAGAAPYVIGQHFFDGCTAMTEVILPKQMLTSAEDITCTVKGGAIPSYMFANTGIVNAVIPAWIVDLAGEGVFANCKQMETVTFLNKEYKGTGLGAKCFYGCSKLKEVTIPVGMANPLYNYSYIFAECSALEKVTWYIDDANCYLGDFTFYNCASLKELEILKVGTLEKDENGTVTGYADLTKCGLARINDGAFQGCASLKKIPTDPEVSITLCGKPFKGCGIEVLVLNKVRFYNNQPAFEGMPNLKEIWVGNVMSGMLYVDDFANLPETVSIYFFKQTYAEVTKAVSNNDLWYTKASEKAKIYFIDTMPADVVWPEEIKPAT
jgi:hypothetical protein